MASDGSTIHARASSGTSARVVPSGEGARLPAQARNTLSAPDADGIGVESIIGTDDRYSVNPGAYPGTATVLITFDGGRCSGWMAGYNPANLTSTIVTAGHCVYNYGVGWRTNVVVYPGYNSTGLACAATTLYTVIGYAWYGLEDYDYGAIKVNCTYWGQALAYWTGWYGYFWTSGSLLYTFVVTQGYPGDKPYTQWGANGFIYAETARQLFYNNDTVGGQSGSTVYVPNMSGCGHCTAAIHAYGLHGGYPHSSYNHGTRITQAVFDNINAWRNA